MTPQYRATAQAWLESGQRHREELERADPVRFTEQQRDRRLMLEAINAGLLQRSLLIAVRAAAP